MSNHVYSFASLPSKKIINQNKVLINSC